MRACLCGCGSVPGEGADAGRDEVGEVAVSVDDGVELFGVQPAFRYDAGVVKPL